MIPKIIHYCWLSDDPFPSDIQQHMNTWKKNLPDYKFLLWNFEKFPKEKSLWVSQAFDAGKYAYAADYIRLYALYTHGGIYMDTDVEVVRSFDKFLELPYMVGTEGQGYIEAGVFGSEAGADWLKESLDYFEKPFIKSDGTLDMVTLPQVMNKIISNKRQITEVDETEIFNNARSHNEIFYLFPRDYFCAKDMGTGIVTKTENTHTVHHFAMSWISKRERFLPDFKRKLIKIFGDKVIMNTVSILKRLRQ